MIRRGMATRSSSSPALASDSNITTATTYDANAAFIDTLSISSSTETLIEEINTVEDTMFIQDDTNADVMRSPQITRQRPTHFTQNGRNKVLTAETDNADKYNSNNAVEDLKFLTKNNDINYTAIKLNWATNKKDRYESHKMFLEHCLVDGAIPLNFKINPEPSIGNHDEEFLEEWNNIIKRCQINLIRHTIQYTEKVITETQNNMKNLDADMKKDLHEQTYAKAKKIIDSTSDKTKTFLEIRKRKKINIIKYGKPKKDNNKQKLNKKTQKQKPSIPIPSGIEKNIETTIKPNDGNNLKQDEINKKNTLIKKLQKDLAKKRNEKATEKATINPLDAILKEKDQIIETLKYDLEQESDNYYLDQTQHKQKMDYSSAVKNRTTTIRQTPCRLNEKNGNNAPDQLEGKQKLLSIFTKEIRLLNEGMQNLEKQFQTVLNTL